MVSWIQRKLHRLELFYDAETIAVIAAAALEYNKTPEGFEKLADTLGFDCIEAPSDHKYYLRDGYGRTGREINPDSIAFIRGAIVQGYPVNIRMIERTPIPKTICDECGVREHCVKDHFDSDRDRTISICNRCLGLQPNPRLRDEHQSSRCRNCPIEDCDHNPMKNIIAIEDQRNEQHRNIG